MDERALAAAVATAFQAFLLTASIASGAYAVDRAVAAETPAAPAFPAPGDTDQVAPGPAGMPGGEGDVRLIPASPPAGANEPLIDPAAAPPGEVGRDPADATLTTAAPDIPVHPIVAAIRSKLKDPALREGAQPDDLAAIEAYYGALSGSPSWITGMGLPPRRRRSWRDQRAISLVLIVLPPLRSCPAEAQASPNGAAALKYARFARGGRLSPARVSTLLDQKPELRDPNTLLAELAEAPDPGAYLRALHPKHEQFEGLRQALIKAIAKAKARGSKPERDPAVQRLIVNMERWRWLPSHLGAYYVWNNIPAFTTRVVKGGDQSMLKAIVSQ
jgi:hypothetical protein